MTRFPAGPASSPGFLLWHLTLRWQRAITAALRPFALTHVQFVLLACAWWIAEHDATPNQLQLAEQAGVDVKMASQVLRKLESRGLLERAVDPADTRARRISLTREGTRMVAAALRAVEDADAAFFGAEADGLTPILQRLTDLA